jgi:hypothetical protein
VESNHTPCGAPQVAIGLLDSASVERPEQAGSIQRTRRVATLVLTSEMHVHCLFLAVSGLVAGLGQG